MDAAILHKYLHAFGHLNRANGKAPHKPVLLLSILDEIGRGHITDNEIVLTVELVAAFREYWQTLPLPPGHWHAHIYFLYRRLMGECFWELVKDGSTLTEQELVDFTSIPDARTRTHFARFAPDLWQLVQDAPTRDALRAHLLHTYFQITPHREVVTADPLAAQLQKLIAEAQSQPKPKAPAKVKEGDVEYLRHALFPKVVTTVYNESCAVCRLEARVGTRTVIEAAHIQPFALSHSDHPSNGLALCRNHHWIFDGGGFSVADDYTLLVSGHLTGTVDFAVPGAPLRLPSSPLCHPDPAALAWHRAHVFKG